MKRNKRSDSPDTKTVTKLGRKLTLVAIGLILVGTIPLLPYWLNASSKKIATVSELRTVIVIDASKPITSAEVRSRLCRPWIICRNGKDNIDIVVLKNGQMPLRPTKAVVQTDEDCAPDLYGDSHCTNRLRLSNGQMIEVKHHHNIQIYPCLTPGETVEIEPEPST